MERVIQDLRFAIRLLFRSPGVTAVAVLSLALGIGGNTAIFSVVNTILLKSLPFYEPDRLVLAWGNLPTEGNTRSQVSATDVADWRSQSTVFEDVTTYQSLRPILSGIGEAERVPAMGVGDGYFRIMKIQPILGRDFTTEEQIDGKDDVLILGYGLWQHRFGADPSVVGKTVLWSGRPHVIVGVLPNQAQSLPSTLIDAPAELYRPVGENYDEEQRASRHLRSIARLKPGVTLAQAQIEMDGIAARLEQQHPTSNTSYGVRLVTLPEDTVGGLRPTLLLLLGAVAFLLLIACANVGNLLLAKSISRQKEIAIRAALGGTRARIVRQLLTESVLLAVSGGALGLLLAVWGTQAIESVGSKVTPLLSGVRIDAKVLSFTLAVSVLTGIIFGLAPALRLSKPDMNDALKEGGRGSSAGGGNLLRSGLVVSEMAMALVLLVGAALMIKTVMRLHDINPGFNAKNVLSMNVSLPGIRYPTGADRWKFHKRLLDDIEAIPGVEAAGVTSVLPFSSNFDGRALAVEDHPKPRGEEISVDLYIASPDYLRTMNIALKKGRELTGQDTDDVQLVALINETMADKFWPGQDPLGKRIKFPGSERNPQPWRTVVGVVNNVSQYALDKTPPMQIYLPDAQYPTSSVSLVVRTADPRGMVATVRDHIRSLDPELAAYDITTLESLIADSLSLRWFSMLLLAIFAAVALSLAAIGIYGVISFSVTQRSHEIGIRMALGAQPTNIIRLVLTQGMAPTLVGVTIGVLSGMGLIRLMSSLLYGVAPTDVTTFALVALILSAVAMGACLVPALRATKIDPMVALRYE